MDGWGRVPWIGELLCGIVFYGHTWRYLGPVAIYDDAFLDAAYGYPQSPPDTSPPRGGEARGAEHCRILSTVG